jgi:hypothetical protein
MSQLARSAVTVSSLSGAFPTRKALHAASRPRLLFSFVFGEGERAVACQAYSRSRGGVDAKLGIASNRARRCERGQDDGSGEGGADPALRSLAGERNHGPWCSCTARARADPQLAHADV